MNNFLKSIVSRKLSIFSNLFVRKKYNPQLVSINRKLLSVMANSSKKEKIAIAQMTATSNKCQNFDICQNLIEEASTNGAKIIFLPEACDYIAESQTQSLELAESIDGPLIQNYQNLAKKNKIWISIGGFHNQCKETNKIYNTHLMLSSEGFIVGQYNKAHLFDVELPDKNIRLKESDYVNKGTSIGPPVDSPIGKIGLGICYDLRFPEFSQTLVGQGAEILTYPSAFTVATGLAHWETLLRSRAIETQCYVVAAAQTGAHNKKRSSYGHAMVVDPWGTVISQCQEGTGIAMASIGLDYLKKIRQEMPISHHRRYDIYKQLPSFAPTSLPCDDESYTFGQVKVPGSMIFLQTKHSFAFVNKRCVVPGHVLVSPIRPVVRLPDLLPYEIADLFLTSQKVQRGMEIFHQTTSSTLTVQDGVDAGQTIKHAHVHILPRRPGDFQRNDDIYDELHRHDKGKDIQWRNEEEMREEANQLRAFFKSL